MTIRETNTHGHHLQSPKNLRSFRSFNNYVSIGVQNKGSIKRKHINTFSNHISIGTPDNSIQPMKRKMMIKRKMLLTMLLMALIVTSARSQSIAESEGTFTLTPSFVSAFMDRGARQSGISFQPTIGYEKGQLALELFCNFPISDKIVGTADPQIDFATYYTFDISPDIFTITPGVTLSTFPRANEDDGFYKATFEPSILLGYTFYDINFSLNFCYDLVMKGPTYEFGIDYSIPIEQLGLEIELLALIGRCDWSESSANSSPNVRNEGNYWQAGFLIPYKFSKNSTLAVGWYYEEGLSNHFYVESEKIPNHHAVGRGVFNVSFSYSF